MSLINLTQRGKKRGCFSQKNRVLCIKDDAWGKQLFQMQQSADHILH